MLKTKNKEAVWSVKDRNGGMRKVRLSPEGAVEVKYPHQRKWRVLKMIDVSLYSAKQVKEALKATEFVAKVTSERS